MDLSKRDTPESYIRMALEEFKRRGLHTILELGCIRVPVAHAAFKCSLSCPTRCDGHSTLLFDSVLQAELISVDISEKACNIARKHLNYTPQKNIICMDAIEYLKKRNHKIDLLYLDAWDANLKDSAEKHLEAYQAAKKNLHDQSIVLIDDTDVRWTDDGFQPAENGIDGKGRLLIPKMEQEGWNIIFTGRQTMLVMG